MKIHHYFGTVCVCLTFHVVAAGVGTDGNWGEWGLWTSCSATCGSGTTGRSRFCDNPAPSGGGLNCSGDGEDTMSCLVMNYCLPSYYGNTDLNCTGDEFGCATGIHTCIDVSKRCDGNVDCEDGSDENQYYTGCSYSCINQNSAVEHGPGISVLVASVVTCLTALMTYKNIV